MREDFDDWKLSFMFPFQALATTDSMFANLPLLVDQSSFELKLSYKSQDSFHL